MGSPQLARPSVGPLQLTATALDMTTAVHFSGPGSTPEAAHRLFGHAAVRKLAFPNVPPTLTRGRSLDPSVPVQQPSTFKKPLASSKQSQSEVASARSPGSLRAQTIVPEGQWDMAELMPPETGSPSGLLEWFWEVSPKLPSLFPQVSAGRSYVVLVDSATMEDGVRFPLYLLHHTYRCAYGDVPVQWVGKEEITARLAGGKLSRVDHNFDPTALQRRTTELFGGRPSVAVMADPGQAVRQEWLDTPGFDVLRLRLKPDARAKGFPALRWAFGNLVSELPPIDPAVADLERLYVARLRSYQWRVDPRRRRRSAVEPERESPEHYWVKMYIAWLHRYQRVTVEPVDGDRPGAIPDVAVEDGPVYYEVETFYGVGDPVAKLNETLDKYGSADEVRIVIPNVQALLFLPDLLRAEDAFEREKTRVSLWTLNLRSKDALGERGLTRLRQLVHLINAS